MKSKVAILPLLIITCNISPSFSQTSEEGCYDKKVKMISRADCEDCKKVKAWLKEKKILLDEIDIESNKGQDISIAAQNETGIVVVPPTLFLFKNGLPSIMSVGYNPDIWEEKFCK